MKKTALIIMILTILSKILGFTREIVLAYFYGTSNISDAYLISWTIPGVIFAFIGIGISTSFIPIYSKIQRNENNKVAEHYMNNIINFLLIINILLVIFVLIFAPFIVKLFASGFDQETYNLATFFTRISILGIFFSAFVYIFQGFLQINKNFVIPALIGIPFNLVIIISIFSSTKININILAVGIVIAKISELMFMIPFARKYNYKYKITLNIKDKYLREMVFLAIPLIISVSVNQINTLVDRTIASQIVSGGISALNYANRLNSFVQGLFVMSIATVMFPLISKMAAEGNIKGLKDTLNESISSINLLVIPTTVGAMLFAKPVVSLLFGRGAFDVNAVDMTSLALFYYSIGMIGFGLREVLSRAFYSLQDTKTPMINAGIGMGLNIILNIILSKYLGIGGLALATSISAIFTTFLLFLSLRKKIGRFGLLKITKSFIKITLASLIMGFFARSAFVLLSNILSSQNLSLLFSIVLGVVVYSSIILFMKIEDVDVIVNIIKIKIKKKK